MTFYRDESFPFFLLFFYIFSLLLRKLFLSSGQNTNEKERMREESGRE